MFIDNLREKAQNYSLVVSYFNLLKITQNLFCVVVLVVYVKILINTSIVHVNLIIMLGLNSFFKLLILFNLNSLYLKKKK